MEENNQIPSQENQAAPESAASSGCPMKCLGNYKKIWSKVLTLVSNPQGYWEDVKSDERCAKKLFCEVFGLLALLPALALFLKMAIVGTWLPIVGRLHYPFIGTLVYCVFVYFFYLAGIYLAALIFEFIAPKFGGKIERAAAIKLVGYAAFPILIGGVLVLLPFGGFYLSRLFWLYSAYLLYTGVAAFAVVPEDKRVPYVAASFVASLVASGILSVIVSFTRPELINPIGDFGNKINIDVKQLQKGLEQLQNSMPRSK